MSIIDDMESEQQKDRESLHKAMLWTIDMIDQECRKDFPDTPPVHWHVQAIDADGNVLHAAFICDGRFMPAEGGEEDA